MVFGWMLSNVSAMVGVWNAGCQKKSRWNMIGKCHDMCVDCCTANASTAITTPLSRSCAWMLYSLSSISAWFPIEGSKYVFTITQVGQVLGSDNFSLPVASDVCDGTIFWEFLHSQINSVTEMLRIIICQAKDSDLHFPFSFWGAIGLLHNNTGA